MRATVVLAVLVVLGGCSRAKETPPGPISDAGQGPVPSTLLPANEARDASPEAGAAAVTDAGTATEEAYLTALPLSGKAIGHTSVVFKVKLSGGLEASFKPRTHRGNERYRGEIAAYHLARALGLGNVPPAYERTFDAAMLKRVLAPEAAFLFEKEAILEGRAIRGAILPWMPQRELLPLEAEPWSSRWHGWLRSDGAIPADEEKLAAQISTMVVFDYVTGNWDRWSGGNVAIDRARDLLLFIDNDGAFYEVPPPEALARQFRIVKEVDRFSKRFVDALRGLGAAELQRALDPLPTRAIEGVEGRRAKVLELIDAKMAARPGAAGLWLE